MNITCTMDPISLREVQPLIGAPMVRDCAGGSCLTVYFESEASRREFLEMPVTRASDGINLDHPTLEWIDEG